MRYFLFLVDLIFIHRIIYRAMRAWPVEIFHLQLMSSPKLSTAASRYFLKLPSKGISYT